MTKVTYKIPNISCGHCVHTIKLEVRNLDGVRNVDASPESKTATITYNSPATEDSIRALLTEINYPAVD